MNAPDPQNSPLGPPQFSVRALLATMLAVAVVLGLASWFGAYAALWVAIFGLALLAHVAGNAIGTRLRDGIQRQSSATARRRLSQPLEPAAFAPTTKLEQRAKLGRPIVVLTALAVPLGGLIGGYLLARAHWPDVTPTSMLVGGVACGVLSGIWTFLTVGFLQVTLGALWEAIRGRH